MTASLGYHPLPTFGVDLGLGAIVDGKVLGRDLSSGFAASLGASYLALVEKDLRPFVLVSFTASVATADVDTARLTAVDLRAGVALGKTFFERLTAYATVRVFGGPVMWQIDGADVTGGDEHHYAVGAGATLRLPEAFDVFVEGSPLGERSLNAGAGWSF